MQSYRSINMRKVTSNKIRVSGKDTVLQIIIYICMALAVFICIYPFWYLIIYSLSDPAQAIKGVWIMPKGFTLYAYQWIFRNTGFGHAFFISTARTVISTMVGRKFVYRFVIITMYLGAGLVPYYITMKAYHLNNSFLLYIVPGIINAYYIILIKTFIEQIPSSLEESARMDGAGFFMIYSRIILPLSKPIMATVAVYASVGAWNSWQDNYLLVQNPNLQTVQLLLYNCINEAQRLADSMKSGMVMAPGAAAVSEETIKMATTIVSVLPIMLVYPFMQKYFVKGVMMGAVKG